MNGESLAYRVNGKSVGSLSSRLVMDCVLCISLKKHVWFAFPWLPQHQLGSPSSCPAALAAHLAVKRRKQTHKAKQNKAKQRSQQRTFHKWQEQQTPS